MPQYDRSVFFLLQQDNILFYINLIQLYDYDLVVNSVNLCLYGIYKSLNHILPCSTIPTPPRSSTSLLTPILSYFSYPTNLSYISLISCPTFPASSTSHTSPLSYHTSPTPSTFPTCLSYYPSPYLPYRASAQYTASNHFSPAHQSTPLSPPIYEILS